MTIKLATSKPAHITGNVGKMGMNRLHDVALIQALLANIKDKSFRPYFQGPIDGRLSPLLEEATAKFQSDHVPHLGPDKVGVITTHGLTLRALSNMSRCDIIVPENTKSAYLRCPIAAPMMSGNFGPDFGQNLRTVCYRARRELGLPLSVRAVPAKVKSLDLDVDLYLDRFEVLDPNGSPRRINGDGFTQLRHERPDLSKLFTDTLKGWFEKLGNVFEAPPVNPIQVLHPTGLFDYEITFEDRDIKLDGTPLPFVGWSIIQPLKKGAWEVDTGRFLKVDQTVNSFGVDGFLFTVNARPLDRKGKLLPRLSLFRAKEVGGHKFSPSSKTREIVLDAGSDWPHGYRWTVELPPQETRARDSLEGRLDVYARTQPW
ncbi:MAG: hypothetical protein HQ511_14755 [Rhodospirillales bacterium]|nr:hypothetical protein [Rhodospirillales bacterium]